MPRNKNKELTDDYFEDLKKRSEELSKLNKESMRLIKKIEKEYKSPSHVKEQNDCIDVETNYAELFRKPINTNEPEPLSPKEKKKLIEKLKGKYSEDVPVLTADYLLQHVGHNIVCVTYGDPVRNVSLKCEDCCEVLIDFDV